MANVPLKSVKFPGLDNTYTIPEIDSTLSTAGKAADAKKTGDEISQLKSDLSDILHSRNLFDASACTDGYYVNYTNGNPSVLANYCYSAFIDVSGLSSVYLKRSTNSGIGSIHGYFYSNASFDDKVSGNLFTTDAPYCAVPNGAKYLVISVGISGKSEWQVHSGTVDKAYVPYMTLTVPKHQKEVDYTYQGGGDLIRRIFAIGDMASSDHYFNFHIPAGTYNLANYMPAEVSSGADYVGLRVPDYVSLVGESKATTILTLSLESQSTAISPINFGGTSGLKHLTVIATNCRYAVHDDFATTTYTTYKDYYYRYVEDCAFKAVNCAYGCYGSGTRGGAIWHFIDCDFDGFSWHSWSSNESASALNSTLPNDITFERCRFIDASVRCLTFKSLGSGVLNKIHIIACSVPFITVMEETSGVGIDFTIDGHGNSDIPVASTVSGFYATFEDMTSYLRANSALTKGNSVAKNTYICPRFNGNTNLFRFYGIALSDISVNNWGYIQHSGYIMAAEIGLNDLSDNDLVGLSSAVPVKVTDRSLAIGCIETHWTTKFLHLF